MIKKGKLKLNLKIQNAVPSVRRESPSVGIEPNAFGRLDESSESRMSVDETGLCLLMKQVELSIRRISCFPFGVLSANQFNADR